VPAANAKAAVRLKSTMWRAPHSTCYTAPVPLANTVLANRAGACICQAANTVLANTAGACVCQAANTVLANTAGACVCQAVHAAQVCSACIFTMAQAVQVCPDSSMVNRTAEDMYTVRALMQSTFEAYVEGAGSRCKNCASVVCTHNCSRR
jgi:hypothetical protein